MHILFYEFHLTNHSQHPSLTIYFSFPILKIPENLCQTSKIYSMKKKSERERERHN